MFETFAVVSTIGCVVIFVALVSGQSRQRSARKSATDRRLLGREVLRQHVHDAAAVASSSAVTADAVRRTAASTVPFRRRSI